MNASKQPAKPKRKKFKLIIYNDYKLKLLSIYDTSLYDA